MRDKPQLYRFKEHDLIHLTQAQFNQQSCCTIYSPSKPKRNFYNDYNEFTCYALTPKPSRGFHHTLYKIQNSYLSSKSQHNPISGSLVYLISCPSCPHPLYSSPLSSFVFLKFANTHLLQDLCFHSRLCQESFPSSSAGISEAQSLLPSNLYSSVTSSKQPAMQHMTYLFVYMFITFLTLDCQFHDDKDFVSCTAVSPVPRTEPGTGQLLSICFMNKWLNE